ncbi:hypothetical protein NOVOSPHI9U_10322 [Novosphingobium sp. 9U]|nr:hypothetical protein NOVOSPHI9U_10322 [Novosphingobium sp. 9U]
MLRLAAAIVAVATLGTQSHVDAINAVLQGVYLAAGQSIAGVLLIEALHLDSITLQAHGLTVRDCAPSDGTIDVAVQAIDVGANVGVAHRGGVARIVAAHRLRVGLNGQAHAHCGDKGRGDNLGELAHGT